MNPSARVQCIDFPVVLQRQIPMTLCLTHQGLDSYGNLLLEVSSHSLRCMRQWLHVHTSALVPFGHFPTLSKSRWTSDFEVDSRSPGPWRNTEMWYFGEMTPRACCVFSASGLTSDSRSRVSLQSYPFKRSKAVDLLIHGVGQRADLRVLVDGSSPSCQSWDLLGFWRTRWS